MINTSNDFIADWNKAMDASKQALSLPLPKTGNGDYCLPNWDWASLIWKKIKRRVFNLQKRIYKATKEGQFSKARSLTKLLNRSRRVVLLGVRKVTQDNRGAKTPGIDGRRAKTPKARKRLAKRPMDWAQRSWGNYKAKPTKRVFIPKANGKMRPLGIPTLQDRIMQAVDKESIEPMCEAQFESNSYGPRLAMSTHDATAHIFHGTQMKAKWVLDADIKGFFDNLDQDILIKLVEEMIGERYTTRTRQYLKAGHVSEKKLYETDKGTPQGGIISPLLANIALNGLSQQMDKHLRDIGMFTRKVQKVDLIRYADDFVVIHESKEVIVECYEFLKEWLATRGLEIAPEKTPIINTEEGFDFVGFNIKRVRFNPKGNYKKQLVKELEIENQKRRATGKRETKWPEWKIKMTPDEKSIKNHIAKLREIFGTHKAVSQEVLINKLTPVIKGWANYCQFVNAGKAFNKCDEYLYHSYMRWIKRKHPNKGIKWGVDKYFKPIQGYKWTFASNKECYAPYHKMTGFKAMGHTKVKEGKSYHDGDVMYWSSRLSKGYGNISARKAKLLKKQKGRCPLCGGPFQGGDIMETHHIQRKADGGKDVKENRCLVHGHCHDQHHKHDRGEPRKIKVGTHKYKYVF